MAAAVLQQWQRLGRRQQLVAVVAASLLGVWMVDLIALRPLRRQLGQLHRTVREAEQRLVDATVAGNQSEAVRRAFAAYEPYVKRRTGTLESELAGVLSEVEGDVRHVGIVLLNLKPAPLREGVAGVVRVSVEGEATTSQLMELLDRLQRSASLLKVTELSVRVAEGNTLRTSMVVSKLLVK